MGKQFLKQTTSINKDHGDSPTGSNWQTFEKNPTIYSKGVRSTQASNSTFPGKTDSNFFLQEFTDLLSTLKMLMMCIPFHLPCRYFLRISACNRSFHAPSNSEDLLKYCSTAEVTSSKRVKFSLGFVPSVLRNSWKAFMILVWCLVVWERNYSSSKKRMSLRQAKSSRLVLNPASYRWGSSPQKTRIWWISLQTRNSSLTCSWQAQQTSPSSLSFTNLEGRNRPRKAPIPPQDLQNLHRTNSASSAATLKSTCFFLKTEFAFMLLFLMKLSASIWRSCWMSVRVRPGTRMSRKSISPWEVFSGSGMQGSSLRQMGDMIPIIYAVIALYYSGLSGSVSSNAFPPICNISFISLQYRCWISCIFGRDC